MDASISDLHLLLLYFSIKPQCCHKAANRCSFSSIQQENEAKAKQLHWTESVSRYDLTPDSCNVLTGMKTSQQAWN